MRDRLIELIRIASHELTSRCVGDCGDCADKIADHILADGWIRPPCKVGDMVYVKYYGEIVNAYVTEFEVNSKGLIVKVYIDPDTDREYDAEDVFLTKEEAEQSLKGGEG